MFYQVTRISIDESGRLVIDLKTVAKFRGQFVLQHPNLEDHTSRLVAPEDLEIQFTLELMWTASTWDGPEQVRWLFLGSKGKRLLHRLVCLRDDYWSFAV